jgi:hypothetical protein
VSTVLVDQTPSAHADAAEAALAAAKLFRLAGDAKGAALIASSARMHARLALATANTMNVGDMDAVERAERAASDAEDIGQGGGRAERPWRLPPSPPGRARGRSVRNVSDARRILERIHRKNPAPSTSGRRSW